MRSCAGWIGLMMLASASACGGGPRYPVVDSAQSQCFDAEQNIPCPAPGTAFSGQDAQFVRHTPRYRDNHDGTVSDLVTGLDWQKSYAVLSFDEARQQAAGLALGGQHDWRLPTIKELYSLALFSGVDASSQEMSELPATVRPFIDPVFDFAYGSNGPRPIDSQLLSATLYGGRTMGRDQSVFGFNAADGRIKAYPLIEPRERRPMRFTVRYVRGNLAYGKNVFQDLGEGRVADRATGLMWAQHDSGEALDWPQALAWAARMNAERYLGFSDWRVPDAKELQSLVDYSRSPQATATAAIDPLFVVSTMRDEDGRAAFPCYWSSTTHQNPGDAADAVYLCFGEALGHFRPPGAHGSARLLDVHGAGAQRADPKQGGAQSFPMGRGPQGDVVRSAHYVRLVRDLD